MSSIATRLKTWLSKPTNKTGLIVLGSTALGYVVDVLNGHTTTAVAIGAVAGGLAHLIWPDNTAAQADVQQAVQDVVSEAIAKKADPATLLGDAEKLASDAEAAK